MPNLHARNLGALSASGVEPIRLTVEVATPRSSASGSASPCRLTLSHIGSLVAMRGMVAGFGRVHIDGRLCHEPPKIVVVFD
jgi:hypothetical protein